MTGENIPEGTGTGAATQQQPSPEQTSPAGSPAENPQETKPQFVTKDDLAQFGKQLASQLKQSDRDRTKRVEAEIAGIRDLVTKAGLQITPQQEAVMREEVGARLDSETNPDASQADTGQYTQPPAGFDPVTEFVGGIFQTVGTSVAKTDAEWADIQKVLDETWNDASPAAIGKVTAVVTKAAEKKAARIAANQETAVARVSGSGSGGSNTNPDLPASKMWENAYKK